MIYKNFKKKNKKIDSNLLIKIKSLMSRNIFIRIFFEFFSPSFLKDNNSFSRIIIEIIRISIATFFIYWITQAFINGLFFNTGVSGAALVINNSIKNALHFFQDNRHQDYANIILYGIILLFNVPFFIYGFFSKYVSKITLFYSMYFIFFLSILGLGGSYLFERINAFSQLFPFIYNLKIQILEMMLTPGNITSLSLLGPIGILIILSVFLAVVYGWSLSIIYSSRGTSGGTDIIGVAYVVKTGKSFGKFNTILGIVFVCSSLIILYWTDPLKTVHHYSFWSFFTSFKSFGTILYISIGWFVVDFFFPRNRQIVVLFIVKDPDKIVNDDMFKNGNFKRSFTKINAKGSYLHTDQTILLSAMTYFEYLRIKPKIQKIDPDAFAICWYLKQILGHFAKSNKF